MRFKWLIVLAVLLMQGQAAQPETLYAAVSERVQVYKQDSVDKVPRKIAISGYAQMDPDQAISLRARVKGEQCLPDRSITLFSDPLWGAYAYGVGFYGAYEDRHYNLKGHLLEVDRRSHPYGLSYVLGAAAYPMVKAKYKYPSGKLMAVAYYPNEDEQFSYTPRGELESYCNLDNCYDPSGKLIFTRSNSDTCENAIVNWYSTQGRGLENKNSGGQ